MSADMETALKAQVKDNVCRHGDGLEGRHGDGLEGTGQG